MRNFIDTNTKTISSTLDADCVYHLDYSEKYAESPILAEYPVSLSEYESYIESPEELSELGPFFISPNVIYCLTIKYSIPEVSVSSKWLWDLPSDSFKPLVMDKMRAWFDSLVAVYGERFLFFIDRTEATAYYHTIGYKHGTPWTPDEYAIFRFNFLITV